jgi:hypothetical protein
MGKYFCYYFTGFFGFYALAGNEEKGIENLSENFLISLFHFEIHLNFKKETF